MTPGKVYLVGAGPGHPELLTVKAAALLKTCDVIVYDRLVQEEVLAAAKPSAERIFMGKCPGRHASRQDDILQLLAGKARDGRTVVRLKGGDPFLFGRGGEEAEFLAAHGIPFEVVPGVSSALAAPLSAGIPVTHRDLASSVVIVTGHEAARQADRVDWEALTRIDTLVFLMAVANVGTICERLVRHGMDPETPAAMIQMAFWNDERAVIGTLASIAADSERAGVAPPATLVVGKVVALHEKLQPAQRDLQRRGEGGARFSPAPGADQLLALATGALGAQLLGFGLATRMFDWLEQARTPAETAVQFGLRPDVAQPLLEAWTAMGLLEATPAGYRNLEIASRYLTSDSPQALGPMLLERIAAATSWAAVAAYAAGDDRTWPAVDETNPRPCAAGEALARFVAPAILDRIDLGASGSILHVGSGAAAYADAIARRWPDVTFATCSLQPNGARTPPHRAAAGRFGSVVLSDVFSTGDQATIDRVLAIATATVRDDGLLVVQDSLVATPDFRAPHVVLGALASRVAAHDGAPWSSTHVVDALERLGWTPSRLEPVIAGTLLMTAKRARS